jgi:hypothetical protein
MIFDLSNHVEIEGEKEIGRDMREREVRGRNRGGRGNRI